MTCAQKIGQLFMVGMEGESPSRAITQLIAKHLIGGVILFSRNIKDPLQCARLTKSLQTLSKEAPLFIGVDQEGGRVSRLPHSFTPFPAARLLGDCNDVLKTYACAEAMALELSAVGINMNFAPVLDIDTNPKNPIIGDRAFGPTPLRVEEHGLAMLSGLQDNKVISCCKHFPGHGDTDLDSHKTLPVVDLPLSRLADREFKPFIHAVHNRIAAMMTAHVLYPQLDPDRPATLSKKIVGLLLRRTVGFSGVIVSDDLEMKGITHKWNVAEASLLAIEAGCDMALICGTGDAAQEAIEAMIHAVEKKEISEERIDQSLNRILQLKEKFILSEKKESNLKQIKTYVGCAKHRALVKTIIKQAAD